MGHTIRRDAGLHGYERALRRAGFDLVAGADEAGRGACAGPLVAGAVILPARVHPSLTGLADSKLLTPRRRDALYDAITAHAVAWATASLSPAECDRLGMHEANLQALRRAVLRLRPAADFVLTDGFPVPGLGAETLAVWKGDRVAACVAAASIIAKVTRDRVMVEAHRLYPDYDFDVHKGYCTAQHQAALDRHGPCGIHRLSYDNVARTAGPRPVEGSARVEAS
ncbi:ribonuclease HII [Propionicicella superfundia]|uniref:ribonuclease HII n=1 Tax=Propionicicella superfundia TaxID=348582 RepID=UPI0003FCD84E|nr:ribonuclease HII [Propionicicella superfundia]